jgi:putative toxin-antitoxin system antitoxin component (TIGR02293 family)
MPNATGRRGERPNPAGSQRAEPLARVLAMAERIWRHEAEARRFMSTPHAELSGRTPVDVAMTEDGAREVEGVD